MRHSYYCLCSAYREGFISRSFRSRFSSYIRRSASEIKVVNSTPHTPLRDRS
jgi:hypothetical protein